jgi:hypothetical protein
MAKLYVIQVISTRVCQSNQEKWIQFTTTAFGHAQQLIQLHYSLEDSQNVVQPSLFANDALIAIQLNTTKYVNIYNKIPIC